LYQELMAMLAAGVPEITGAALPEERTVIENAGSKVVTLPSLTPITMFE
jgi:hypothetical protein